jgi:hypothetical protein
MHEGFCMRNNRRCQVCGEVVRVSELDAHVKERHSPVPCAQCGELVAPDGMEAHVKASCSRRAVQCRFCAMPLEHRELGEHEAFCGAKTRPCEVCGRAVTLCDMDEHLVSGCRLPLPPDARVVVGSDE